MERQRKVAMQMKRILFGVMFVVALLCSDSLKAEAATDAQKKAFEEELEEMLYTADTSTHNVSSYRIKVSEFNEIYESMQEGEERWIIASYYSNMYISYSSLFGYVTNITIMNVDDDVLNRYERLSENVEMILSGLDEDMTDLDKVIYFHDAIVDLTSYQFVAYQSYGACGILGDEVGVCAGYTKALNLLLDYVGIESDYISCAEMDHGWSYVKLDGEWYLIDSTWDDTRSQKAGLVSHQFLLRNDDEFENGINGYYHKKGQPKTVSEASTSTRFSDWYLHDVVGKMYFDDGYWYYVDRENNTIMKNTTEGKEALVVLDGSGWNTMSIVSVEDGIITYRLDNKLFPIRTDVADGNIAYATIGTTDFADFSVWRSGVYYLGTGQYMSSPTRISLNDYVIADNSLYIAELSDKNVRMLIRELDENRKVIKSCELRNGDMYSVGDDVAYVAISIYDSRYDSEMSYEAWKEKFEQGFIAGLQPVYNENEGGITDDEVIEDEVIEDVINDNTNEEKELSVESVMFTDFSVWRSGLYHWGTGQYVSYPTRISLNGYVVADNTSYIAESNDKNVHMLIRELDANKKLIKSYDLVNGDVYTVGADAAYLAISIYNMRYDSEMSYKVWEEKFAQGLIVGLQPVYDENEDDVIEDEVVEDEVVEDEVVEDEVVEDEVVEGEASVESVVFTDFAEWRTGLYHWGSGQYVSYPTRISLNDYVVAGNTSYIAMSSEKNIHMLVRELDANKQLVCSYDLAKGVTFTLHENTKYLAISLYNVNSEASMSYNTWMEMFANGLAIGLVPVDNE